eukprot:8982313-Pyramimonas_sp.AAC.1
MDKAQARSQWRSHQHTKKKNSAYGRGAGDGGAAAAAGRKHKSSRGSGPTDGLGSNFDRYDEVRQPYDISGSRYILLRRGVLCTSGTNGFPWCLG